MSDFDNICCSRRIRFFAAVKVENSVNIQFFRKYIFASDDHRGTHSGLDKLFFKFNIYEDQLWGKICLK